MSQENSSTGQAVSGAFGGEIKYFFYLMICSSLALFACMFGSVYLGGYEAATIGMIIGIILAGGIFIGGWLILYLAFFYKSSKYQHLLLIIRPENYLFNVFYDDKDDDSIKEELDPKTQQPTGWKNKHLYFMEPTPFSPKYINDVWTPKECIIHFYGNWSELVGSKSGTVAYKDMEMPNNSTDILDVIPVLHSPLNVKHGDKIPIFQLVGGRYQSKYFNPEAQIPNPNTHQIKTVAGLTAASTINEDEVRNLRKQLEEYKVAAAEHQRQGREDKKEAIRHEVQHELDYSEMQGLKEALGNLNERVTAKTQRMVTYFGDWWDAYNSLRGGRWGTIMPFIIAIVFIVGIFALIGMNPQWVSEANMALQNPYVDAVILGIAAAAIAVVYLLLRRRSGRKR